MRRFVHPRYKGGALEEDRISVARISRSRVFAVVDLYALFYNAVSTTPAVSWIKLRIDTHLRKLRNTPAAHVFRCIIIIII